MCAVGPTGGYSVMALGLSTNPSKWSNMLSSSEKLFARVLVSEQALCFHELTLCRQPPGSGISFVKPNSVSQRNSCKRETRLFVPDRAYNRFPATNVGFTGQENYAFRRSSRYDALRD